MMLFHCSNVKLNSSFFFVSLDLAYTTHVEIVYKQPNGFADHERWKPTLRVVRGKYALASQSL